MIAVTHVIIVEQFMHIITELVKHTVKHATNVIAVIITAKCVMCSNKPQRVNKLQEQSGERGYFYCDSLVTDTNNAICKRNRV